MSPAGALKALSVIGALLLGVWLAGALDWLPAELTPEKLLVSTWPLLVGGGLAALGAWGRQWLSADPPRRLPPADVGVLLEKVVAGARLRRPARPGPTRAAAIGARLGAIECRLGDWPVVGVALLALVLLLLWLLMGQEG